MDLKALRGRKGFFILLAVFLIAFSLRLTTAKYDRLLGADPWYHYKIADLLLESGDYPMWEYYSRYPYGAAVVSPPGLYYLPVYIYKISFARISLFRLFQLLPAFLGSLSVVPLYLLVKELYSKEAGVFASLLYAISPAAMERGLAGYYRGDVFFVFMMLFALYFFIGSVKRNYYYSFIGAGFVFLSGFLWNGWPFLLAIMFTSFVLGVISNYFQDADSKSLAISYVVVCGAALFLMYFAKSFFYRYEDPISLARDVLGISKMFLLTLLVLVLAVLRKFLRNKQIRIGLPILIFILAVLYSYLTGYLQSRLDLLSLQLRAIPLSTKGIALMETTTYVWRIGIGEQQRITVPIMRQIFGVPLLLLPLGMILALKRRPLFTDILLWVFLFSTLSPLVLQIRFAFFAALGVSVLGAIVLSRLTHLDSRKLAFVVILLIITSNVFLALEFGSDAKPFVSENLYDSLLWIKDNTPEDSVILSWWDYTGPIVGIADRKTVTHTAPSGIVESFSLMLRTSNETQALGIVRSLNEDFTFKDMKVDYVIIDARLVGLWPKISRFEPFVNRPAKVENREMFDSMLYRLYNNENLANFKLVFQRDDVKIYEPIHNYTRITELELDKRYYRKQEDLRIRVRTRSNEYSRVKLKLSLLAKKDILFSEEYVIDGTASEDISIHMLRDMSIGTYRLVAELYTPQTESVHSMGREFLVIG